MLWSFKILETIFSSNEELTKDLIFKPLFEKKNIWKIGFHNNAPVIISVYYWHLNLSLII